MADPQVGTVDDLKKQLGMDVNPPANEPAPEPSGPTNDTEPQQNPPSEPQGDQGGEPTEPAGQPAGDSAPSDGDGGGNSSPEPEPAVFDIKSINEKFSTEFSDESELKAAIEASRKTSELEEQLKELQSVKDENLLLRENLDPSKYFDTEDDFKVAQFKKQFPDKDPSVAYKVFTSDLSQLSDKDVLLLNELLDNPGVDESGILGVMERKYGIEDWDELDNVQTTQMRLDANKARKGMESLKGEVKLPEKVDVDSLAAQQKELLEQKKEQASKDWDFIAKEVVDSYPDLVITDKDADGNEVEVFKYDVNKDFPKELVENSVKYMVDSGVPVTEDAVKQMASVFRKEYIDRNLNDIVLSAVKDARAKAEEERLKQQHNPGTPTPQKTPPGNSNDVNQKVMDQLNSRGFQRRTFLNK